MILLSHSTGNEFVRQALVAFEEAGMLREFWTTLSWNPDGIVHRLLPASIRQLFERRAYPASIRSRTHTVPLREIGRLLGGVCSIDDVGLALDRKVAARLRSIANCKLVYAYEDTALRTFEAASERGISRVYDLPIGYWRAAQRIFAEEKEREPEWAVTLTGIRDTPEKLARKDEELELAQRIVVASSFTKQTLAEGPGKARIDIIPYGAPTTVSEVNRKASARLKLLFAGALGQRKGLADVLKAVEMLGDRVELTLLGRKTAPDCRPLEAATRKYRWIPTLNHAGVLREMYAHDLLVFPSLFEGFGLVALEAMAQGTPVVTTPHTCGPDIIEDGVDGFIVPDRLMSMKIAARRKAEMHPWSVYRQRLVEMARDVIAA
jgi:glycosyltransferase involved in cell wall biosynthesis